MAGLTLQEFLKREETEPASEFACGEAFQKPMPEGIKILNSIQDVYLAKEITVA